VTASALDDVATVSAWLADRLAEDGIEYALSGALALAVHGVPRMTNDVDVSVFAPQDALESLFDALERAGCIFRRDHARSDAGRMALFRVLLGRVSVDVFLAFPPHGPAAMQRRVKVAGPDGVERWYSSAEDLAVHKLALFRDRDRDDLAHLFAAQGERLDLGYVRRWVEALTEPGDPRRAELESLAARFVTSASPER